MLADFIVSSHAGKWTNNSLIFTTEIRVLLQVNDCAFLIITAQSHMPSKSLHLMLPLNSSLYVC